MEQPTMTPPNVGGPAPKKKPGCLKIGLIVLGVMFGISLINYVISGGSSSEKDTKDTTAVVEEQVEEIKVDSAKVKELKPLFTETVDEFKGVTWIEPKSKPKYTNVNSIYSYFSIEDGKPRSPRLKITYAADDWLFIRSFTFLIDGKTYEFSNPTMNRDNNSTIWEWSDDLIDGNSQLELIVEAMEGAKEIKMRCNGDKYYRDRTLSQKDIKAVLQPIKYYEALGGK